MGAAMAHSDLSNAVRYPEGVPVFGIAPYRGYELLFFDVEDSDGFWTTAYLARGAEGDRLLEVSRFLFNPSQARFEWIVDMGFPAGVIYRPGVHELRGPLCNATIDNAIEAAAAAKVAA